MFRHLDAATLPDGEFNGKAARREKCICADKEDYDKSPEEASLGVNVQRDKVVGLDKRSNGAG